MGFKGHLKRYLTLVMAAGALLAGLIVMSPGTSGAASKPTSATWAEAAQATPNFILPFYPAQLCSVNNVEQFQFLMYRPLYWFGAGTSPNLNTSLSLGKTPSFSNGGTTVTIDLKNYKWANGESVTAQDVLFFMNIYHAEPANFCGYVKGDFPDNVTNVTASGTTVTFTFNKAYNEHWIIYNELGQITPMPVAWDIASASASPGSGGCSAAPYGTADAACAKVYTFLANSAGYNPTNPSAANNSLSTYASNPLWQIVDGPWKLSAFNPDGQLTMVPNPTYSGPVKPTLKTFTELPYTSDSSEFNALVGGNLSVGYIPLNDLSQATSNPYKVGPNNPRLSGTYDLSPLYTFSINYFPENFDSNANGGVTGKLFNQLYIRQALQYLVNQPLFDKKIWKGYAVPTYGPVPVVPAEPLCLQAGEVQPLPVQPGQGQGSSGGQRMESGTQRNRHLHQGRNGQG